jgi:hypothetical protein
MTVFCDSGNNIEIDYRWSAGNEDDTRKFAAETRLRLM